MAVMHVSTSDVTSRTVDKAEQLVCFFVSIVTPENGNCEVRNAIRDLCKCSRSCRREEIILYVTKT